MRSDHLPLKFPEKYGVYRGRLRGMAASSHHSAYAEIALFIATVTAKAWLRDRFDGLFNGATRAAGRKDAVERG